MNRVLGLGAGGHAGVILEVIAEAHLAEVVALLDPNPQLEGTSVLGVPVLVGGDERLTEFLSSGVPYAFNGVGGFGRTASLVRRRVYENATRAGFEFVVVTHPRAFVSSSAEIGRGAVVLANAVVNTAAKLGENVIINTAATVDHHCVIDSHVHIAPGVHLAGGVQVGEGTQIGIGACVRENVRIGRNAVIGAGAAVLEDVPENVLAAGVPARILKSLEPCPSN